MLWLWIIVVFVIGAAIGSFLNVCIYRLPLEKSILWPGSRCGHCLKPIRFRDNIPLLSYWLLGGRCRECGVAFSMQYFWIELVTAFGFVGLFDLVVIENIHEWPSLAWPFVAAGIIPLEGWVAFGHHALLFCLLLVVAACDWMSREIPLSVTLTGTAAGLVLAVCFPWPWPLDPDKAIPRLLPGIEWWLMLPFPGAPHVGLGLYPWPVWGPPPSWLPADSWSLGLVTGLAGALAGTMMLRWVRVLATKGLGMGEALGLGDADLMMMAGAFIGWQPVVIAFFLSTLPALLIALFQMVRHGEHAVTFGPSLAIGVMATYLLWPLLGPIVQVIFFNGLFLAILAVGGTIMMILSTVGIRVWRWLARRASEGSQQ